MQMHITGIVWDTDGVEVDLPSELIIDTAFEGIKNPSIEVADWLSDKFGWCVNSFNFEPASDTQHLG